MDKEVRNIVRNIFILGKTLPYRGSKKINITKAEKKILNVLGSKIISYLKNVFDRYMARREKILMEAKLASYRPKEVLDRKVLKRDIAKKLNRNYRMAINEAKRVIDTESWNTLCEGYTQELFRRGFGKGTFVYRIPRKDACPVCKRFFLRNKKIPRIYKLGTLIANGSNVGRRVLKPTIDSIHPNCQCSPVQRIPEGFGFDKQGRLVVQNG